MGEISRGAAEDWSKKFVRPSSVGQDNLGEKCGQSSQWPSPYVSREYEWSGPIPEKGTREPRLFFVICTLSYNQR